MNINTTLITCTDENDIQSIGRMPFFSFNEEKFLWFPDGLDYSDYLEKLVFNVARRPKRLIAHLQRIFYCFYAHKSEQLFAAIIDFLVILNKRGEAISWRVVIGARSQLSSDQFQLLKDYLKNDGSDVHRLPANQHSIFTKGLLGVNKMIRENEQSFEKMDYDPLELARDHIEYSQLEEARQVLENAVVNDPKRVELQQELLGLYQSTRDSLGFNRMLAELNQLEINMVDEWGQLEGYFKGRSNNG